VKEAARNGGHVQDATWKGALDSGWADTDLAEAFAYLGVMLYVACFVAYAGSEPDPAITVAAP
jgi:hypothetical protein